MEDKCSREKNGTHFIGSQLSKADRSEYTFWFCPLLHYMLMQAPCNLSPAELGFPFFRGIVTRMLLTAAGELVLMMMGRRRCVIKCNILSHPPHLWDCHMPFFGPRLSLKQTKFSYSRLFNNNEKGTTATSSAIRSRLGMAHIDTGRRGQSETSWCVRLSWEKIEGLNNNEGETVFVSRVLSPKIQSVEIVGLLQLVGCLATWGGWIWWCWCSREW